MYKVHVMKTEFQILYFLNSQVEREREKEWESDTSEREREYKLVDEVGILWRRQTERKKNREWE